MNYTKGEWFVTKVSPHNNWRIYIKDSFDNPIERNEVASLYRNKDDADLIVAAVNTCISVNPDNPLAVAESIKEMREALKVAETRIHNEIRHHPEPGTYREMLQDELRQISKALANAEVK